jgi:Protein of unknown function (DUF3558)
VQHTLNFRGNRAAKALLFVLVGASAVVAPLSSAGASTKKHPASYFTLHPCALIPRAEVVTIFAGAPMAPGQASPNAYGGSCAYTTTGTDPDDNVNYSFSAGTASSVRKFVKTPLTPEKSVGHNAYCSGNGGLYADAGTIKGAPAHLIMAAGTCAADVKFAKAAFAHLS